MNFNSVSNTPYNSFYNDNPYRQYGYAQMPEIAYQPVYNQPYQYMQEPPSQENPAKTLGLALFLQGISSGLERVSNWFATKLSAAKEFASHADVEKVANSMVTKNKLDVNVAYINESNKHLYSKAYGLGNALDPVAKGENAFFVDKLKLAVAPESKPSLILHELGHAVNAKKGFTKLLQNTRRFAPFAPMALLFANRLSPNKQNGEKTFIERNAGLLGFAAFLPTIIEEGIASLIGIKDAKKVLNNPKNLNILKKNYAFALATYILSGVALGVASKQTILAEADK